MKKNKFNYFNDRRHYILDNEDTSNIKNIIKVNNSFSNIDTIIKESWSWDLNIREVDSEEDIEIKCKNYSISWNTLSVSLGSNDWDITFFKNKNLKIITKGSWDVYCNLITKKDLLTLETFWSWDLTLNSNKLRLIISQWILRTYSSWNIIIKSSTFIKNRETFENWSWEVIYRPSLKKDIELFDFWSY